MAAPAVLTNPNATEHWTTSDLDELDLTDKELAEFVAAAPKMARALKAILTLDLGHDAERLVRAEVRQALGA
ncbi:hypothetical protein [Arthrobacter sp. UYCo732]|uniref:hypothetical protein n=1 Tax=Arthrobacter sp. UYCo732 TaxID=3156336 RepID=UPI0033995794